MVGRDAAQLIQAMVVSLANVIQKIHSLSSCVWVCFYFLLVCDSFISLVSLDFLDP